MTLDTNSEMKYYTGLGLTLAVMVFVSGSSGYDPLYKEVPSTFRYKYRLISYSFPY